MSIRIGVVGGGLIAQVAHLPILSSQPGKFTLCALAEPSRVVRDALAQRYGIRAVYADWRDMVSDSALDAVVVCSPHATHAEVVLDALASGLHVFVEKPLCIDPADCLRIVAARDRAGRVVQVGYMKRFDPVYQELLEALPDSAEDIRLIDVVTYDPSLVREPFVPIAHLARPTDLGEEFRGPLLADERRQTQVAVGRTLSESQSRVYAHTFLACVIHDTNVVHGMLEAMGEPLPTSPIASHSWAGDEAALTVSRLNSGTSWTTSWLLLRGMHEFRECVRVCFKDEVCELEFPSPYSSSGETQLIRRQTKNERLVVSRRAARADSYRRAFDAFFASVADGAPCCNPPEESLVDIETLRDLFLLALN